MLTKMRSGERLEDDRTDWKRVEALSDAALALATQGDPDTFGPGAEFPFSPQNAASLS